MVHELLRLAFLADVANDTVYHAAWFEFVKGRADLVSRNSADHDRRLFLKETSRRGQTDVVTSAANEYPLSFESPHLAPLSADHCKTMATTSMSTSIEPMSAASVVRGG